MISLNQSKKILCICDALLDLVPFAQFKKREKKNDGGVLLLVKVKSLHGCFSRF